MKLTSLSICFHIAVVSALVLTACMQQKYKRADYRDLSTSSLCNKLGLIGAEGIGSAEWNVIDDVVTEREGTNDISKACGW